MNKLVFYNIKGGVGKTTTSLNVAAQAVRAQIGATALYDCDFQRNSTRGLGSNEDAPGLDEFMAGNAELADVIQPHTLDPNRLPENTDLEKFTKLSRRQLN